MIPDILRHVPRKGENLMFNEKKLDELATPPEYHPHILVPNFRRGFQRFLSSEAGQIYYIIFYNNLKELKYNHELYRIVVYL